MHYLQLLKGPIAISVSFQRRCFLITTLFTLSLSLYTYIRGV